MPVAGLFDRALKATLGHSLREGDRPLYNLVNKLFESRNKIAHRGHAPDDKLSEYVRAASDVFQWLDRMFRVAGGQSCASAHPAVKRRSRR